MKSSCGTVDYMIFYGCVSEYGCGWVVFARSFSALACKHGLAVFGRLGEQSFELAMNKKCDQIPFLFCNIFDTVVQHEDTLTHNSCSLFRRSALAERESGAEIRASDEHDVKQIMDAEKHKKIISNDDTNVGWWVFLPLIPRHVSQ